MAHVHQEEQMSEDRESRATITSIQNLSTTVKGLVLKIHNPKFSFKAGQWVDFLIDGCDVIAGYSMCSSPTHLEKTRLMRLAVQYSDHPPTLWVHSQCQVGSEVTLKVGGGFHWPLSDRTLPANAEVLLVAGGLGINPLLSILEEFTAQNLPGSKALLLYSAKTEEELIFKDEIDEMVSKYDNIDVNYWISRESPSTATFTAGRITDAFLREKLPAYFGEERNVLSYICGPPPMIDSMETGLLSIGLNSTNIRYEKWW